MPENNNVESESDSCLGQVIETWCVVTTNFKKLRIFFPNKESFAASTSSLGKNSSDHMIVNINMPYWQESMKTIEKLDTEKIDLLKSLSEINCREIKNHMLTWIFSVALSAVLFLVCKEATWFFSNGSRFVLNAIAVSMIVSLVLSVLALGRVWSGYWRAFELDSCIEFTFRQRLAKEKRNDSDRGTVIN